MRLLIRALVALIMIPVALLVTAVSVGLALLVVGLVVAIPLLPFAFAALFVWAVVKLATPRSRAAI